MGKIVALILAMWLVLVIGFAWLIANTDWPNVVRGAGYIYRDAARLFQEGRR